MNLNTKRNLKLILASGSLAVIAAVGVACGSSAPASNEGDALKIGYLAAYTGSLAEFGPAIEKGVQLAVEQINASGGVNGQDVTYVTGDTAQDNTQGTAEAQRLINTEGVHAIVGALSSDVTLAVASGVIKDAGIPLISPASTSPAITDLEDNGFVFRTTLSDAAQGIVLADNLIEQSDVSNLGVIVRNDPYGLGLEAALAENFDGDTYSAQSYEKDAPTYLAELNALASATGGEALVIIGFAETEVIFRESEQNNLFDKYFFVDGNRSVDFATAVGAENLEGFRGTAPTGAPANESSEAWDAAYEARFGALPSRPFVREAYDAVIAIALAAERAGSLEGAAIRDQLRGVGTEGGLEVIASVESIRAGLQAAVNGDDVNYEGAASGVEWDENGDITSGFVAIWEFQNGAPTNVETFPVTLN